MRVEDLILIAKWSKVAHAHVLVVECLGEVVHVVNEELAAVNVDLLIETKVMRLEVVLDFIVAQLHVDRREVGLDVVAVLWHFLASYEDWKRIVAVIWLVNFADFQSIVDQVVLNDKRSRLAKHGFAVVPDSKEAENFAVHFQELFELVKVSLCLVSLELGSFLSAINVWISGNGLWWIDDDTFTLKPSL